MLNELKESTDRELNKTRKTMHEQNKSISDEIETIKKSQTEILKMKTIIALKNSLFSIRLN